jgi:hypothetical protein
MNNYAWIRALAGMERRKMIKEVGREIEEKDQRIIIRKYQKYEK